MGIPERWLNKAAQIAKFAINIKNLRRACKNVSGAPRGAGGVPKKRVTSRKNNSPDGWESVSTEGAVHENRGHERPLLESGAKNAPKLVQPTAMRSRTDRASYKSWRYW